MLLQADDEFITVRGFGVASSRTYNSRGVLSDVGQDAWLTGLERSVELVGELNESGSTVRRRAGDGSIQVFKFSGTANEYVSVEGDNAHDTLTYMASSRTWTYTEGTSRVVETYADHANASLKGRLTSLTNGRFDSAELFTFVVGYDSAGRVVSLLANDGAPDGQQDGILYTYNEAGQLQSIQTRESGARKSQVSYGYENADGSGRLTSVEHDLRPGESSSGTSSEETESHGRFFRTTYDYVSSDPSDARIGRVRTSDGVSVSYTYESDAKGGYRIKTLTKGDGGDGASQALTFNYLAGATEVTDATGAVWTYEYDANGRLSSIMEPAVDGLRKKTAYTYDADGNLARVTQGGSGQAALLDTVYQYDENGNRKLSRDRLGNVVTWTYNAANQVTSETRYTTPDPDGLDSSGTGTRSPSGENTFSYIYDSRQRLVFSVSAAGAVTEYSYHASGNGVDQVSAERRYTGEAYSGNATLESLQLWTRDKTANRKASSTLKSFDYDAKGRLQQTVDYAAVSNDAAGHGVLDKTAALTRYVYDAQGLLRQKVVTDGQQRDAVTPVAESEVTDYVYDGMGRLLSKLVRSAATAATRPGDPAAAADWDVATNLISYSYDDARGLVITQMDSGVVRIETRNSAGDVTSVTERDSLGVVANERITQAFYDASGRLRAARDAAGGITYSLYDAAGRIVAQVDPTGTVTETRYDAAGRVVKVLTYANQVDTRKWMSGDSVIIDRLVFAETIPADVGPASAWVRTDALNDRVSERTYDAAGRLSTESDGRLVRRYAYDGRSNRVRLTISAPELGEAGDRVTRYFYDTANQLLATLDAEGYLSENVLDATGRVVKTIRYATATVVERRTAGSLSDLRPAASTLDQQVRMFYDGRGNVVGTLDAEGYLTEKVIDEAGRIRATRAYATRLTGLTGDERFAEVRTLALADGLAERVRESRMAYNALGQLVTRTNPEGTVTRYRYDMAGRLVKTVTASGTSEVRENSRRYDVFGNLIGELGGESSVFLLPDMSEAQLDAAYARYGIRHAYDALGRRIESIDAEGNKTWYAYDSAGRQTFQMRGVAADGVRNAAMEVSETRYNAFGQKQESLAYTGRLQVTVPGSRASALQALSTLQYVANLDKRQTLSYDTRGLIATRTDGNGYLTRYSYTAFGETKTEVGYRDLGQTQSATKTHTYDRLGRLLTTSESSSIDDRLRTLTQTFDAFNRTSIIDGRGITTRYDYDRLGRQVTSTRWVAGRMESVRMAYDAYGRVVSKFDAAGNETRLAYSDADKSLTVTSPEGVTVKTVYNAHGQILTVTDGLNQVTTHTYDKDGRLTRTEDAAGGISRNEYDVLGRLHRTVDATGRMVELNYDAAGRVLNRVVDPEGLRLTTVYTYDGQGRQIQVVDPSGVVTQMKYDAMGQLVESTVDPLGLALRTTYAWDGLGRRLTMTEGAGTASARTVTYAYDGLGRRVAETVDPDGLALETVFTYDGNDNVLSRTDAGGRTTRHTYDDANRLVQTVDADNGVTRMTYDVKGQLIATRRFANRMDTAGNVVAADDRDQQDYRIYDKDGRVRFMVDGEGAVTEMAYDAANRVTQVRSFAAAIDMKGLREGLAAGNVTPAPVADNARDVVKSQIYDAAGRVIAVVDAAGAVTQTRYDAAGRVIATKKYSNTLELTAELSKALQNGTVELQALITPPSDNPAAVSAPPADEARDITSIYVYDQAGRLAITFGPGDSIRRTIYDPAGRVAETIAYGDDRGGGMYIKAPGFYDLGSGDENDPFSLSNIKFLLEILPGAVGRDDRATTNIYDSAGRLEYVLVRQGGDSYPGEKPVEYPGGRPYAGGGPGEHPGMPPEGPMPRYVDNASARAERYVYDAAGRVVSKLQYGDVIGYKEIKRIPVEPTDPAAPESGQALNRFEAVEYTAARLAEVLSEIENPQIRESRTVYDSAGRAVYAVDALGGVVETAYDRAGRVEAVRQYESPVGVDTRTAGQLAQTLQSSGVRTTRYERDAVGRLVATIDALGNRESYRYDANGNEIGRTLKSGAIWSYAYDAAGRKTRETSPRVEVSNIDAAGKRVYGERSIETAFEYDALNNVTARIDDAGFASRRTEYVYDNRGNQVKTIFSDPGRLDPGTNRMLPTGDRPYVEVTYNALGQAVAERNIRGDYSFKLYDRAGRVSAEVDQEGAVTLKNYSSFGDLVSIKRLFKPVAIPSDPRADLRDAIRSSSIEVDESGWAEDGRERMRYGASEGRGMETLPGVNKSRELRMRYDTEGRVLQSESAGGERTRFTYNAYGELVEKASEIRNFFNKNGVSLEADYVYSTGVRWARTAYYRDALGREEMSIDPEGYANSTEYDGYGNVVKRVEHAVSLHVFNDLRVSPAIGRSLIESNDGVDDFKFDPRVKPQIPPPGTSATGFDRIYEYGYDALGRKTSESLIRNVRQLDGSVVKTPITTNTRYDEEGRITQVSGDNGSKSTQYDALGRAISIVQPERSVLRDDAIDQLKSNPQWSLDRAELYRRVSPVTTTYYDAFGNVVETRAFAQGILEGQARPVVSSDDAVEQFGYDWQGRQIWVKNAQGALLSNTYDAAGNLLTSHQQLSGAYVSSTSLTVAMTYDRTGRVLTTRTERGWNENGRARTHVDQSNQVRYNTFGEVIAQDESLDTAKATESFAKQYQYDVDGNLARTNEVRGVWRRYQYAGGKSVSDGDNESFYDRNGNAILTIKAGTEFKRTRSDRWGNVLYVEDTRGARVDYEYNELNQLEKERQPYVRIVEKTGAERFGRPERYVFHDALGREIATRDPNGNVRQSRFNEAGQLVGSRDGRGTWSFAAFDTLGRSRLTQDGSGLIKFQNYDSAGRVVSIGNLQAQAGARIQQTQESYVLNELGHRLRITDALGGVQQYDYDSRGLVLRSRSAAGLVMTYAYDSQGNKIRETNALSDPGLLNARAPRYEGGIIESQFAVAGQAFSYTLPATAFSAPIDTAISISATVEVDDGQGGSRASTDLVWDAASRTLRGQPREGVAYRVAFIASTGDSQVVATGYLTVEGVSRETWDRVYALGPQARNGLSIQRPAPGENFSYVIPDDAFVHPQGEALTYKAYIRYTRGTMDLDTREEMLEEVNQEIGPSLSAPYWLTFDAASKTLSGTVPRENGAAEVVIVAIDTQGRQREQSLVIDPPSTSTQNGRRTKVDKEGETVFLDEQTWDYDAYGRLIDHNDLSGVDYDYGYGYDNGSGSEYGYGGSYNDSAGRLESESSDWTQSIASITMQVQIRRTGGFLKKIFGRSKKRVYVPVTTFKTYSATREIGYDQMGRTASIREGNGNNFRYEYDEVGNRIKESSETMDGSGQRIRLETRMQYDLNNRLVHVVQEDMDKQKRLLDVRYSYDAAGNRVRVDYSEGYGRFGASSVDLRNRAPSITLDGEPVYDDEDNWGGRPMQADLPVASIGEPYTFTFGPGVVTDPDGDPVAMIVTGPNGQPLPSWLRYDEATRTLSGTPPVDERGMDGFNDRGEMPPVLLRARAFDWNGGLIEREFRIRLADPSISLRPGLPAESRLQLDRADGYSQERNITELRLQDYFKYDQALPVTPSITLADGGGLPAWLSLVQERDTYFTSPKWLLKVDEATAPDVLPSLKLRLTLTGTQGRTATVTLDAYFDRAPIWKGPSSVQLRPNESWSMTLDPATLLQDIDGDVANTGYRFKVSSPYGALPPWVNFDAATGTLSATPPESYVYEDDLNAIRWNNQLPLTIQVEGGSTTRAFGFLLDFNPSTQIAATKTVAQQIVRVDQDMDITLPPGLFQHRDGAALTYSAKIARINAYTDEGRSWSRSYRRFETQPSLPLPAWLRFDPSTLRLTGRTPAQQQNMILEVTAADAEGNTAIKYVLLTVVGRDVKIRPMSGDGVDVTWMRSAQNGSSLTSPVRNGEFLPPDVPPSAADMPPHLTQGDIRINIQNGQPFRVKLPEWVVTPGAVITAEALPDGVRFDPATRTFSGTLGNNQVRATLIISDAQGRSTSGTVSFVPSDLATVFNKSVLPDALGRVGQLFEYVIPDGVLPGSGEYSVALAYLDRANPATGYRFPWSRPSSQWGNGLSPLTTDPDALLYFDPASGVIKGKLAKAGVYQVRVSRDGASADFAIGVDPGVLANPRLKESLPNQRVRVGQPFSYTVPADWLVTDNGEPATLDTRRLPAWLRFDAATRTFSGTPTLADAKQPAIPLHLKTASGERATANWWVEVYETYQQPPANADFSEGDTGWDKGTGFAIVEKDGRHVAQARIGKTFDIVNNDWAVIRPGVKIRA
ncbi:hypothetical protein EBB59_02495, partial [Lysobacter pythonis]